MTATSPAKPVFAKSKTWTQEECDDLMKQIEKLRPWFYSFDFGQGITSRQGQNPHAKFGKILKFLPADLNGASCLDCPSSNAQLLMLLKDRGAGRCIGRDIHGASIEQGKLITSKLGYDIDLAVRPVQDLDKE